MFPLIAVSAFVLHSFGPMARSLSELMFTDQGRLSWGGDETLQISAVHHALWFSPPFPGQTQAAHPSIWGLLGGLVSIHDMVT